MTTRRGLGAGRGKGYKNLIPHDRPVHRDSGRGIKQPQIKMIPPVLMKPTLRKNAIQVGDLVHSTNTIIPYRGRVVEIKNGIITIETGYQSGKDREPHLHFHVSSMIHLEKDKKQPEKIVGGLGDTYTLWDINKITGEKTAVMTSDNKKELIEMGSKREPSLIGNGLWYCVVEKDEKVIGGLGDNRPDSDFDPKELKKGIKVEMEHTKDPAVAKEISKDHLTEDSGYYKKLAKMEKTRHPESKKYVDAIDKQSYGGYKIGDLRKIFSKYQDEVEWKNPVDAIVPTKDEADKLAKAIEFFQADEPKVTPVTVPFRHPEGLVTMGRTIYQVKSRGYQA